ncbi:MAG: glycerate kinase type-2 family protein [Gammaproteobacteria bacterium]
MSIFQAGLLAADPYSAVKKYLIAGDIPLEIPLNEPNADPKRMGRWSKVHIISFGKAACAMAKAAREIIPDNLCAEKGIAVTNYENVVSIKDIDVFGASHPLPDEAGLMAAKTIAERVSRAKKNELVLVLVSGGGSALIPYPVDSISLQEKIAATGLLLASGATINQINCVRKHLSRLKGGGLARLAYPADCHALVLSDVLGDDISAIASGPTVPDSTTFADAIAVLKNKKIWGRVPASIRDYLIQGLHGDAPETPKPGNKLFKNTGYALIGSNKISLRATEETAANLGYKTSVYSDSLSGIAREAAEALVISAKMQLTHDSESPIALLAGGETTVVVTGQGKGGRNQEMALAFALAAQKHRLPDRWVFLSGGTDGRDGPTDAAGGMVDSDSIKRMAAAGIDPMACLADNDSYHALLSSQDLLETGATGTNVADLQVLLIHPHTLI